MKRTPPGTRALIKEYLKRLNKEKYFGSMWIEEEISKRIGNNNAVLLDSKVITAHKGEIIEGTTSYWIFVQDRIGLDDEDNMMPVVQTPFDDLDEHEEAELEIKKSYPKHRRKKRKRVAREEKRRLS